MKSRCRLTVGAALLGLVVGLTGCAPNQTEREIAKFDPAEVQMLRENAQSEGLDVDDVLLLSTLRFREVCRDVAGGLADLASGSDANTVADSLGEITEIARADGQPDMVDAYTAMIDELRLGDSSQLQNFHLGNCSDVK